MTYTVYRDGGDIKDFDEIAPAITWGREREAFEIRNEDEDYQVYVEYPRPCWV